MPIRLTGARLDKLLAAPWDSRKFSYIFDPTIHVSFHTVVCCEAIIFRFQPASLPGSETVVLRGCKSAQSESSKKIQYKTKQFRLSPLCSLMAQPFQISFRFERPV